MIEFSCPACQAQIRVADGAGGKKGTCPQCKTKIVVPSKTESSSSSGSASAGESEAPAPPSGLPIEFKPADESPQVDPHTPAVTQDSVPDFDNTTAPIIEIPPEDKAASVVRRIRTSKKKTGGGLVVPMVCAAVLIGFVGWYFWQTRRGLSPDVTGEVVTNPQIADGLIALGNVSVDQVKFDKVRHSLEANSLSLVSSTHLADVTLSGNISGIVVKVKPVKGALCVKVSLDGTKVAKYVSSHAKELNEFRMQRIRETADRFIAEWAAAIDAGEKEIPHLNDIRDDMALASVVSGFGYHVVAWDGKTAAPCVGVDTSGDLYFFVKPDTRTFIIRGRELEGDTPGFPGEIVVQVPQTGTTLKPSTQPVPTETPPESDDQSKENEEKPESDATHAQQAAPQNE